MTRRPKDPDAHNIRDVALPTAERGSTDTRRTPYLTPEERRETKHAVRTMLAIQDGAIREWKQVLVWLCRIPRWKLFLSRRRLIRQIGAGAHWTDHAPKPTAPADQP